MEHRYVVTARSLAARPSCCNSGPAVTTTNRPYVQYVRLRFSINSQLSEQQDDAGLFPGRLSVLAGVPAADTRRRHRSPH